MMTEGATNLGPGGLPALLVCGVTLVNDVAGEALEDAGVCGAEDPWSLPDFAGVLSLAASARFESPLPLFSVEEAAAGVAGVVEELPPDASFFLDEVLEDSFARDSCEGKSQQVNQ